MNGSLNLHPKVAATLLAGWIVTLIVYGLHQWAHVDLPGPANAALVGLVSFAAGWLAPSAVAPDVSPSA